MIKLREAYRLDEIDWSKFPTSKDPSDPLGKVFGKDEPSRPSQPSASPTAASKVMSYDDMKKEYPDAADGLEDLSRFGNPEELKFVEDKGVLFYAAPKDSRWEYPVGRWYIDPEQFGDVWVEPDEREWDKIKKLAGVS